MNTPKRIRNEKADDGGELRENLDERPLILDRRNRKQPFSLRNILQTAMEHRERIHPFTQSDFNRIAIEYDEPARNYLASDCLAAAIFWVVLMLFGLRNQADFQ